jgi:23S rRNA (cytidine1920-2'-O)/16S rRNA (cytidine1409-2'-O)-methyltransferase
MKKPSLLDLLCTRDQQLTREDHYARILCGEILVDGQCVRDPQQPVEQRASIEYKPRRRYVSRGGQKLEGVLKQWKIPVQGMSFVDAGASTGGFTDCLLQHGASRVIAIEAGENQLDYRLRTDPRVHVLENTNVMEVHTFSFEPDAAVADLSLRSLRRAAHHILSLVSQKWLIALVKPQYEWHEPPGDFDGVVTQTAALVEILKKLLEDLRGEGVFVSKIAASQLLGKKGNREFFCLLTARRAEAGADLESMIAQAARKVY